MGKKLTKLTQHSTKVQYLKGRYEEVNKIFVYKLLDIKYKETKKGIDIIGPTFVAELKGSLKGIKKNKYEGYSCTETQYQNYPSVRPELPIFWLFCYYELEKQLKDIRKNAPLNSLEEKVINRKITVVEWDIVKELKIGNPGYPSRFVSHKLLDILIYNTYKFDGGILRLQNKPEIINAFAKYVNNKNIYKETSVH